MTTRRRLTAKEIKDLEELPRPSDRVGYSTGIIKQPNYHAGSGNAQAAGEHLKGIAGSAAGFDVKFYPGMDSKEAAMAKFGNQRYSETHKKYGAELIYAITAEGIGHDGIPETIVRKAQIPGNPIYMVNGYKLVKSRQEHRHGYDTLVPNIRARNTAKLHGITRKNYETAALKFDAYTGEFKGFKDLIPKSRVDKVSKQLKLKMQSKRLTLGDAFLFFLFEPDWRCFTGGIHKIFQVTTWKAVIPKLLQLYVQAKRLTLRTIIAAYGGFDARDIEYFNRFEDTNQFLDGRGALIDAIWTKFVDELMNKDAKQEWILLYCLIRNIIAAYPEVESKAMTWIENEQHEISGLLSSGAMLEDEAFLENQKLKNQLHELKIVGSQFRGQDFDKNVLKQCRDVNMTPKGEKVTHFPQYLTNKMKANIVNFRGVHQSEVMCE
jgi:hypothetical protein